MLARRWLWLSWCVKHCDFAASQLAAVRCPSCAALHHRCVAVMQGLPVYQPCKKTARGPHRRSNAAVEFRMSATTQFYPLVLPSVAAVHCKRLRLWIHAWRRAIIIFGRIDVGHPGGIAAFSRSAPQQCRAPARHHCGPTFLHHCSLVRRATRLWQALHALCAYTTRQPLTNHGAACLLPPSRTAVQLLSRLGRWQRRWRGRCVDARRGWGGVGWVGARMG